MKGPLIYSKLPDGKDITDPKQTSHYLWFAIQRRVLSYLLAQKEVDTTRIGAKGYSYGGTLMWNLGMDSRVKAIVAYFGIGWIEYYRNKGVRGIKGFRVVNNQKGTVTEKLSDPKWQAPAGTQLGFKFYCTEPQTLILTAADHNTAEIEITASDDWQDMVVPAAKLINRFNKQPMKEWSAVGKIAFAPKPGSDITKVIFAEFKWVK
jgi:hypothetical protein